MLGVIAAFSLSISKERFVKFTSTKTNLCPANKTEEISEIQVRGGTMISPSI